MCHPQGVPCRCPHTLGLGSYFAGIEIVSVTGQVTLDPGGWPVLTEMHVRQR